MARHAVTGAFGFSGRYIAARLLEAGHEVLTLTNHQPRSASPSPGPVAIAPLVFDAAALARSLDGVDMLFNTYWVRFSRGGTTHALAVENSLKLIDAARMAGVRRIVHVSIANPDATSKLPYYNGKARVEAAVVESGMGYAILRPTVLFGDEPILVNNVAWLLRRFPIFGIPGDGSYGIQPIHVADLADLAVGLALLPENVVVDAAGPETLDFTDFVKMIRGAVGSRSRIVHGSPGLALFAARLLGRAVGDVLLTREEMDGLMAGLLVSHSTPLGRTGFAGWLTQASPWLGREYLSEVKRHFGPVSR
ncbi:MAG: SDR family oxidoreductase [Candidatus Limnocylindrales bacterium]